MDHLEQLKSDFDYFRDQCMELRNLLNTHLILFSDDDTQSLLKESAGLFFDDLHTWMSDAYYLQVGRLTDSVKTFGNENLTIKTIVEHLQSLGKNTASIERCAEELASYRELTKDARNKRVAHSDLKASRSGAPLSSHGEEAMGLFFNNLQ